MEDVLGVYERPYEVRYPVVCMDEMPKQLLKELRQPLPPGMGQAARYDYEYERNGIANVFLFCEPLGGQRTALVRERRTASVVRSGTGPTAWRTSWRSTTPRRRRSCW